MRDAPGAGRATLKAKPLGQHHTGGIFTPDGQGGGTLAWVEWSVRPATAAERAAAGPGREGHEILVPVGTLREIRKEAHRAP